LGGVCKL